MGASRNPPLLPEVTARLLPRTNRYRTASKRARLRGFGSSCEIHRVSSRVCIRYTPRLREKEKLIIGEGWMPALDATARRLRLSWNITLIKPSWKKRERNNFLGRSWEWKAIAIIVRPARQPISCLPLLSLDFASLQRITLDVGKDCRFGKDLSRSRIRNFGEGWIRILFVWFRLINRKCSFKE